MMFSAIVLSWALIDGDTMRVTAEVRASAWIDTEVRLIVHERVRFLDIDTPEIHASSPCERELAQQSTSWVGNRLAGAAVIQIDAEKRDSFGRVLAHVYVDGIFLNGEMLKRGMEIPVRPYGVKGAWC